MRTALKKRWTKALRSGKYKQGKSALRKQERDTLTGDLKPEVETFCCLGVLCDLVEPKEWELYTATGEYSNGGNPDDCGMPREDLQHKLGLDKPHSRNPNHAGESIADQLAKMNDDGRSFKVIANWIEKHL